MCYIGQLWAMGEIDLIFTKENAVDFIHLL